MCDRYEEPCRRITLPYQRGGPAAMNMPQSEAGRFLCQQPGWGLGASAYICRYRPRNPGCTIRDIHL